MGHGVTNSEVPTGVKPPVHTDAGLMVCTGTAPINSVDLTNVNKPVLCNTLEEFVSKVCPMSDDFDSWTLCEQAKAAFSVYSVAPVVFINVIDPENPDHISSVVDQAHLLAGGEVQLQVYGGPDEPLLGVIKSTVVVKVAGVTKDLGADYTIDFDDDGVLVVTRVSTGTIPSNSSTITASFDYLDPTGVTDDDVIGGYSGGSYTGLEVIKQVYPALRLVPGLLLAPKYSQTPEVAARLATIAASIDGFRCMAVVDLPTDPGIIATYAEAPAYKSDNGFDSINHITCWPKFKNGDDVYHMSTHVACVANVTDASHGGVPFDSPSNKDLTGTAAVDDDGNEILLIRSQANSLNDQGIVTALNGFNGWKVWGNRTGGYPGTTDPKDAFIPIRRMFNWIENTTILTVDRDVDSPGNRRLIDGVVGTMGAFVNSLVAQGALVDGKIEFRADENPLVDLSDGHYRFHNTLTPPSPAEELEFITEYDPTALAALFA